MTCMDYMDPWCPLSPKRLLKLITQSLTSVIVPTSAKNTLLINVLFQYISAQHL